ncbi:MAG: transcriptional regulator [Chloroflexi bacterium]|nr:transcriptional regulator [Chloroflexota bacterium]
MEPQAEPDIQAVDEELAALNGLLEHRVRLAVCVLLSSHDALTFTRLKQALGETDGSLGAHMRKLEDAEFVAVEKTFQGRRPVTWYSLTALGRTRLKRQIDGLTQLIDRADA